MDTLAAGAVALRGGEWARAVETFEAALSADDTPEGHDGLGLAKWWMGQVDEAVEHRERAYVGWKASGQTTRAAGVAVWLAREHLAVYGNDAAANGWLARAERLLDGAEVPERGWLELVRARRAGSGPERAAHVEEGLRIAGVTGDADLEVAALAESGLAAIEAGDVVTGLDRLDEAMAAATGGETALLETVADACCSLVAACDLAGDAGRLEQWAAIVAGFVERRGGLPLLGFCRTCNAQMLAAGGERASAERELLGSIAELGGGHRSRCVDPSVKLAEVRILQGRLEEASALLEGRTSLPEAVIVTADLDIARGDATLAEAGLLRRLNRVDPDGLLAAPLHAKLQEAYLSAGDLDAAARVTADLARAADASGHPLIRAYASLAAGRQAIANDDLGSAAAELAAAATGFDRMGLPLLEARSRFALATATQVATPEVAAAEAAAARERFARAGADREADAAAKLHHALGGPARTGPRDGGVLTRREDEVLQLLAEGLTNAQIAERLFITPKTAAHHVGSILAKLGLANRAEAAAFAVRARGQDRAPR